VNVLGSNNRLDIVVSVEKPKASTGIEVKRLGPFGSLLGESINTFRTAWETVLRLAEITDATKAIDGDLHWHDLRHECGSRFADDGMDARHIQMLLGHADLKTTERYLNSDTKRLGEAMKRAAGRSA
jgi:site-specific recombinase XerD